jgi:phage-related protein
MVVDPVRWLAAGSFDIVFNCRPERFLTNGEVVMSFNASGNITNATDMPSKPLIRVYGDGSITVNGTEIEIAPHSYTYIDIDCDLQEAFFGSQNANGYISLDEFPKLDSGANSIVLDGVTRLEVTPRWWRL